MIARKGDQPKARKLMAHLDKYSVRVGGAIDVRLVPGSAPQHTDRLSSRALGRWTESTTNREIKITTSSQLRCSFLQSLPLSVPSLSRSLLWRCDECGSHMVNTCLVGAATAFIRRVFDAPVGSIWCSCWEKEHFEKLFGTFSKY